MLRSLRLFKDESATAAIEFAFVVPLFMVLTFGIIAFGSILSTYQSIEQLAAEAARASLGGSSDGERDQLARGFVSGTLSAYPFISSSSLTVSTTSVANPHGFKVSLSYDMSRMFAFSLGGLVPLPVPRLVRSSVVLIATS